MAFTNLMDEMHESDSRVQDRCTYPLYPALFAIIFAWTSGANCSTEASDYIKYRKKILADLIPGFRTCGSMSHDTILRLLKTVKFCQLHDFLIAMCQDIADHIPANGIRVTAGDSKTQSEVIHDVKEGQKSPEEYRACQYQYCVTLFDKTNNLSLTRDEVYDKASGNKDIIRLLSLFSLDGSIAAGDTLNITQAEAKAVIDAEGDYCLEVKDNRKKLQQGICEAFEKEQLLDDLAVYAQSESERGQDKIEARTVIALPSSVIPKRILGQWAEDSRTIFFALTSCHDKQNGSDKQHNVRYYISSLDFDDPNIAQYGLDVIGQHWDCRHLQHHILDVIFGQDMMRAKNRNYIRNSLLLNKIALNTALAAQRELSKKDKSITVSRSTRILGYDPKLLCKCLCDSILQNEQAAG